MRSTMIKSLNVLVLGLICNVLCQTSEVSKITFNANGDYKAGVQMEFEIGLQSNSSDGGEAEIKTVKLICSENKKLLFIPQEILINNDAAIGYIKLKNSKKNIISNSEIYLPTIGSENLIKVSIENESVAVIHINQKEIRISWNSLKKIWIGRSEIIFDLPSPRVLKTMSLSKITGVEEVKYTAWKNSTLWYIAGATIIWIGIDYLVSKRVSSELPDPPAPPGMEFQSYRYRQ